MSQEQKKSYWRPAGVKTTVDHTHTAWAPEVQRPEGPPTKSHRASEAPVML